MRFEAIIDGIHFDKKGTVKISLVAASPVSLDELTTIEPKKDEPIQVILESKQTKIGVFTPNAIIDEEAALKLKEAAERLREVEDGWQGDKE